MITTPPPANQNAAPLSALDSLWPELCRLRREYLRQDEFGETPLPSSGDKYPRGKAAQPLGGSAPRLDGGRT